MVFAVKWYDFPLRTASPNRTSSSTDFLACATVILGRPPFDVAHEEALMREYQIDTLVSKASGGEATRAKIDAAAKVGARIILIRRPVPPDGDRVGSVEDALGWLYVNV